MKKELPKITKSSYNDEVLTRGKMDPIVEDLKAFIKVTAKGTENVLRKEMQEMEKRLSDRIDINTVEIKTLSNKIGKVGERLDDHEARITTLETVHL